MHDHKFNYLAATNFLCFEDKVEFFLDQYGPIAVVKGLNKDTGEDDYPASNGAGKSSIQEIISYTFYGKTIKKPKQMKVARVVNAKKQKNLEVEVQFDNYRIVRKQKPASLRMWKSEAHIWDKDSEITRGTMADTQEMIEEVIGLSHQAFCNVIVFDDSNTYSFLESDTPTKRMIVENLLGLDQYRQFNDIAKELRNSLKLSIKTLLAEYERTQIEYEQCDVRIAKIETQEAEWKKTKKLEASRLMNLINSKQKQLGELDADGEIEKYQSIQNQIQELSKNIDDLEVKKANTNQAIEIGKKKSETLNLQKEEVNERIQTHKLESKQVQEKISKSQELIQELEDLAVGAKCSVCHGTIDESNYQSVLDYELKSVEENTILIKKEQEAIADELTSFKSNQVNLAKLDNLVSEAEIKLKKINNEISVAMNEMNRLVKTPRPDMDAAQQVLENEITQFKKQLKDKAAELEGSSPYREILVSSKEEKELKESEVELKKKDLAVEEEKLPYYDFWVNAFGDKGIRKFVVEGIIPSLNDRIAYWLQHLYDGQITLSFDNELIEEIHRNGVPAYYPALSNGEKQRVNLAVSQSFAYVMMLNSGTCPSIAFLDEITGGGIDKSGVNGVFNMICELSKERQVFVTTHNEYLLSMLEGYEEITLVKENDATSLVV